MIFMKCFADCKFVFYNCTIRIKYTISVKKLTSEGEQLNQ